MALFFPSLKRGWLQVVVLGLLLLLPIRRAEAITNTFYNVDGWLNQTPPIQATNFVNAANFSYTTANSANWLLSLYANWQYVQNFTNTIDGEMDCNSGFYFYNWTPQNGSLAAKSFYNAGPINCGVNNSFYVYYYSGFNFGGYGGIDVWATNISNIGGVINIGVDGLARFTGNNIDFENGSVMLESASQVYGLTNYSQFASPNISATGEADMSTNAWSPSGSLGSSYAYSGFLNNSPYGLDLYNSVPYFDIKQISPTNYIVRMIFLQDTSTGVTTNVYFNNSLSDGFAHVEWVGTYTDPASGQPVTGYFYLDNDYVQGSSSNILYYGDPGTGVPDNYTLYTSTTQVGLGTPATSVFYNGLISPSAVTTNIYSYVNARVIPTDVATNQMLNGAPSLLPGRVEVTAANSLNLVQSSFSGMNYMLLSSTNEFDTDGQSPVAVPYSDIYLGRTNGSLNFSNVIASALPIWSGSVQAWTTRWSYTDTNNSINNPYVPVNNSNIITYDFRVLLVSSQLAPTSASQEGTVALYSSNNVVISDVLNISSNLFLNCTNLLLTTNGVGIGAASPDGELNLLPATFSWAAATTRLRCLTNNGAIRLANTSSAQKFGSTALPYWTMFNTGLINNSAGLTVNALDFENYGTLLAGSGAFTVQALTATMSNSVVQAGLSVSATATKLVISGTSIQAGKNLTLAATNLLTDNGVTNGNYWSLGAGYTVGTTTGSGLTLSVLPATGDLLGTTIYNLAISGIKITDTWAGTNAGYSLAGFHNNAAVGQLVLDAQSSSSKFNFTGTGTNNAIYVDCLYLKNFASFAHRSNTNLPPFSFNNMVIYYAQAIDDDGTSVAEKINGFNTNHFRWVPTYAGYFSSTNIVYPDGTTNAINAALAASSELDSDRDGTPNNVDPTPVLVASQVPFGLTLTTNHPPLVRLMWRSIPLAGNYIYYNTNLLMTNWLPFTNFSNYYFGPSNGPGTALPNTNHSNYFISPQPYINGPAADNYQMTNVWVFDVPTNVPHYYRIMVQPN